MADMNDIALLRNFAANCSEAAFAELVRRHINLVYSVARRFTGNNSDAEDVTQAVFIILAHKAARLPDRTLLTGWLYETTRFTAMRLLRTQSRRRLYEQEASVQTMLEQSADDPLWQQLKPHLETAMSRLGAADRTLLALRFYENKTGAEAAAMLGIREETARRRTNRALEKLRKLFARRGVDFSTAIIAGTISANSVQAAPAELAQTISAAGAAKGAAASASTLTLAKGALKLMAWAKVKTAIAIGTAAILAIGITTVITERAVGAQTLEHYLPDGSLLTIDKVSFDAPRLNVEFRVSGDHAADSPLVTPAFFRQFRCVVHGESGIDYIEEFWTGGFRKHSDGFYNFIQTSIFPRDSRWLWFRIESSPTNNPFGPWQSVAEFKIPNPSHPANHPWTASAVPVTNTVDDMNFVLGEVTVEIRLFTPRDIWNHVVCIPTTVFRNGLPLKNWDAVFGSIEDASGNYDPLIQKHRSLDPRYVWKLDFNFQPTSDFSSDYLATVTLPDPSDTITTNIMNVPVSVTWDGRNIKASIPTNHSDVALKYINAADDQGNAMLWPNSSYDQYMFSEGNFMAQINGIMTRGHPTTVTLAVVPNIKTTFYVQPRLIKPQQ